MISKATRPAQKITAKTPTAAPGAGPWNPHVDRQPDFNPFANIETPERSPGATLPAASAAPTIRDPALDTAPLQGTRDLSDPDSLIDVIATGSAGVAQHARPKTIRSSSRSGKRRRSSTSAG